MRDEFPDTEPAQLKQDKVSSLEIDEMRLALLSAGWQKKVGNLWKSPSGALFYGPAYAYKIMTKGCPPMPQEALPERAILKLQKAVSQGIDEGYEQEIMELEAALRESVKLQSHYAKLLNQYDGGERLSFASIEEWIARLKEVGRP